jgi:hypothetical protein
MAIASKRVADRIVKVTSPAPIVNSVTAKSLFRVRGCVAVRATIFPSALRLRTESPINAGTAREFLCEAKLKRLVKHSRFMFSDSGGHNS